jgi:hypothetical protein
MLKKVYKKIFTRCKVKINFFLLHLQNEQTTHYHTSHHSIDRLILLT